MVETVSAYDFATVIDGFFTSKKIEGRHAHLITAMVRSRALSLLGEADVRYMPAFKILDMLAALVNIAGAVAEAPQLRPNEVQALLRESLSDSAPLVRQFMLEAALERARYEPLMLPSITDTTSERDLVLQRRWAAMRAAHQEKTQLPDAWIDTVDTAVEHALQAHDFRQFRKGPLLQLFAEMLGLARKLSLRGEPREALAEALSEDGTLWRRYALKSARYGEKHPKPKDIRAIQPPSHTVH